ncbi:hypothetical protein CHGG_09829 [Chaetomium globosum CBS 148.51]|uniref:Amine oxidase domain-containing protein n=1 Tax=Chaetomium globosum (strain ATCC 6205 / CBS 148.51 / DSM 1962 / NBRC 6347 / NRRL 1970) TaxID=306901 RepID=Q2GQC5_CHAGB|nr:uncharacterized protein CHGG_09829 [Chaetomium globosum CBS 148.51]EAQ83425.1 hypothetical protein CHGG_09829 [Chaetomium globosum CBS 148.51]
MLSAIPVLAVLGYAAQTAASKASYRYASVADNYKGQYGEVIQRDVCVIGGGASGVHAAVSLKDKGKTVVVVERLNRLGGNTLTYVDSITGIPIDIGVVVFQPLPAVLRFFDKFKVPLANTSTLTANVPGQPANLSVPAPLYQTIQTYTDLRDGSGVNITRDDLSIGPALAGLAAVMAKYSYILDGFQTLPHPVPEDLVMPFGDFMTKHNLTAAIPIVFQVGQGLGSLLQLPTLYVIKYFNLGDVAALREGYLTQAQGNNSLLYVRAASYLGPSNILFESTVISANRRRTPSNRAELLVSARDGGVRLLSCAQILLTIPPTLSNLAGWDLTPDEHAVFSQLTGATGYWTGLVRGVGLNQTVAHQNAAATTPFQLPVLPALYQVAAVGVLEDVWWVKLGADTATLPDEQVRARAVREMQRVQAAQGVPVTEPEWLMFDSHAPFMLHAGAEVIRGGFYKRLAGLQGGLGGRMFYSGAAFHTHYSGYLWRYNEDVVIPMMTRKS